MEEGAIKPDDLLGPENEEQWDRLRSQLDLADGFWLGFVFSPSPPSVVVLRERTERILRAQTRTLFLIQPATPKDLRDVLEALVNDEAAPRAGCTWVEAVKSDAPLATERPWAAAWDELFLRMNVRRDVLRRRLPGGLVFAAPPEIKPRLREAAPDLWSVRSLVVDLKGARHAPPVEPLIELEDPTFLDASGLSAPTLDLAFALAEVARRGAHGDAASQARALLVAAEGLIAAGRASDALDSAREAWKLYRGAATELTALEAAGALALLARTERLYGDPAAAAEHIQEAIERRRRIDRESVPLDWYYLGGGLARGRSDLAVALGFYDAAAKLARTRAEKHDGVNELRDLSIAVGKLGVIQREMGDLPAASSSFEESLRVARRVHELAGDDPRALRDLSLALTNLAKIRRDAGDLAAAAAAVAESLALCRRLRELDGGSAQSLRDLFKALTNAGTIWRQAGDLPAATAAFDESLALHTQLRELHGDTPNALRELSVALDSVGKMRREVGDLDRAVSAFEESLALRRRLRELHGDTPQVLRHLAVALNNLGTIRREVGDLAAAAAAFEESLAILRRIDGLRHDAPQALRDLSISLSNLGEVRREAGDFAAAAELSNEARALRERLSKLGGEAAQKRQPTGRPAAPPDERSPPARVRITTGVTESVLPSLMELDARCAAMYRDAGFDAAAVPGRSLSDFVALAKHNSIKVAEADNVVAGLLAWHDESPGVAYLVDVQVHPDYQRFGIAADLLDAMREEARGLSLQHIVVRAWEKATWAMTFYRRQRFMPIDAMAPAKVQGWKEERLATGKPLTRPGEVALWSPIGPAPKILTDEMDFTLLTGEIPGDDD